MKMCTALTLVISLAFINHESMAEDLCKFVTREDGGPDVTLFGTTYTSNYVPSNASSTGDSNGWAGAPINYRLKDCSFKYCYAKISCNNVEEKVACFPDSNGACPNATQCKKEYERNLDEKRFSQIDVPIGTKVDRHHTKCETTENTKTLMIRPPQAFLAKCQKTTNEKKEWDGANQKWSPGIEETNLEPIACITPDVPCTYGTITAENGHPEPGPKVSGKLTNHSLSMFDSKLATSPKCPSLHASFMIADQFRNSYRDTMHFKLKLQADDQAFWDEQKTEKEHSQQGSPK